MAAAATAVAAAATAVAAAATAVVGEEYMLLLQRLITQHTGSAH
jgi:hypothetical protein